MNGLSFTSDQGKLDPPRTLFPFDRLELPRNDDFAYFFNFAFRA
jgi:hypothetical protein